MAFPTQALIAKKVRGIATLEDDLKRYAALEHFRVLAQEASLERGRFLLVGIL